MGRAQLLLGIVGLAHAGQREKLHDDGLVRRARALARLVERSSPVVVLLECALWVAANDGAYGLDMPSHRSEVERLVTALASELGRLRIGHERRLHRLEGSTPASRIVQRQPALPRVILLLEVLGVFAHEAQLLRSGRRRVAEGLVEVIGWHVASREDLGGARVCGREHEHR